MQLHHKLYDMLTEFPCNSVLSMMHYYGLCSQSCMGRLRVIAIFTLCMQSLLGLSPFCAEQQTFMPVHTNWLFSTTTTMPTSNVVQYYACHTFIYSTGCMLLFEWSNSTYEYVCYAKILFTLPLKQYLHLSTGGFGSR